MATATVQIPATGTYRIDPADSSVSFTTRHLFGLGAVEGTFGVLSGEVTIADPVTASTARAVIDARQLFQRARPARQGCQVREPPARPGAPAHQVRVLAAGAGR